MLLVLLAFRSRHLENSFFRKTGWVIVGSATFLLVLLSFRRTIWAELAIGALVLAALQKKRRIVLFASIVVAFAFILGLGGQRVYQRVESMNPFAAGQSEYTSTNEDHVNDVLDALGIR